MQSGDTRPTRTWRVLGIELGVLEDERALRERACRRAGVDPSELRGFRLARKSLDARRLAGTRRLRYVVHADLQLDAGYKPRALERAVRSGHVEPAPERVTPTVKRPHASLFAPLRARVVVLGAGPGGLFAALILARHGLDVTVLDRGSAVEKRSKELVAFHRTRVPNPESNLLFGEGGAGTYSDGKLYTRVDDPLEHALLEELVACGAGPEILFDARAHIGTDRLHRILPRLRERLLAAGVRCAWNTRLSGIVRNGEHVRAVRTSAGEIGCDALVLAPGHSARDTWELLVRDGVPLEAKPFQIGVRIEHPQELIDRGQFGPGPEAQALGAASYQLVCRAEGDVPAAHSFCMCPGGRIVASVNEAGFLCTNGMSNAGHSSRWANAAVVTTVGPEHFGAGHFAGVEFQRELEARFFVAGGGDYTAPAQRANDFLEGRESRGALRSSYTLGLVAGRIDQLLPERIRAALAHSLRRFEQSIPGFAGEHGLFVGLESRSSGPVRIPRERTRRTALGFSNIYPVGEGAGFAGGIMSAALDGAHSALALLGAGVPR